MKVREKKEHYCLINFLEDFVVIELPHQLVRLVVVGGSVFIRLYDGFADEFITVTRFPNNPEGLSMAIDYVKRECWKGCSDE